MANDLKWREAITKVLEEEKKAFHYTEIAQLISEKGYRKSVGATPANTVSSNLNADKSSFVNLGSGLYILRKFLDNKGQLLNEQEEQNETEKENNKIIQAYGIYWERNSVLWKSSPDLFGIQQPGSTPVNFNEQIGIYLLHDSRETIYVGQAVKQSIGKRLKFHDRQID